MPGPAHRRRTLLGVLVVVSLLLMTLDAREGPDGPLGRARHHALAAFTPLAEGADGLVRPLRTVVGEAGALVSLREDHAALREEHEALRARAALLEDLERENAALREALGMAERLAPETVAATVIGRAPGTSSWSVLLDVGTQDGVAADMAVVGADGLLGKVVDAASDQSRVELVTSPTAGYAVRVGETGQQGLVSGRGDRPLELLLLDGTSEAVPAGSEVRTRAFPGSTIPDGIPVGVVEPAAPGAGTGEGLAVRPRVDPSRLGVVLVVVDGPGLAGPEAEEPG